MEEIDVKKVVIALALIIIICVGIFVVVRTINTDNTKNYTLEQISEADYRYFAVYTEGKYGIIDVKGKMVIENNYSNIIIPNPTKPVFFCIKEDGTSDILNEKSEKIFFEYKKVQAIPIDSTVSNIPYEKSLLKYEEEGKYGLIDFSGKIITKAIYEEISSVRYKEGEILVKKDGKYGVINNKGIELIPTEYDEIEADKYYRDGNYSESGYIVKKTTNNGYRYGYINSKWKVILDTEYTSISRILDIVSNDIYLIASKNGQYGVIKNKNIKINFAYQSIGYNKDSNLYAVQRSSQYGVIDIDEKVIVPIVYKSIGFNGIYINAKSFTEDEYFNLKGEKVENSYIAMTEIDELDSFIAINKDNFYGIINKDGKETTKSEYLYIEHVFDGYFVAYKEGQGLGVIDKNGKVYIDFKYDVLSKIGDKKLLKGVDMKNNITDIFSNDMKTITSISNGNILISDDYIEIYNEEKNEFVTNNGELKETKEVLQENKLFAIYKEGKWGFEDKDGAIKVNPSYDYVTEFNRYGFAGIKKNGKWGAIDDNGNIICEPVYEFEEDEGILRPEFIGKYIKIYSENNEIYYTDEVSE